MRNGTNNIKIQHKKGQKEESIPRSLWLTRLRPNCLLCRYQGPYVPDSIAPTLASYSATGPLPNLRIIGWRTPPWKIPKKWSQQRRLVENATVEQFVGKNIKFNWICGCSELSSPGSVAFDYGSSSKWLQKYCLFRQVRHRLPYISKVRLRRSIFRSSIHFVPNRQNIVVIFQ